MEVLADAELFTSIKNDGVTPAGYMQIASAAYNDASLTVLSSKIARIGSKIQLDLHGPGIREVPKYTEMADYLAKQKLRVAIDPHYSSLYGTGPITEEVVNELLGQWNFHPENIQVRIRKCNKRWGSGCYVEITFEKR